ncbi:hypothetical protein MAR_034340 [Mya arenaria]|uniref:Reverse transcriptase domain-containing protein n=1 Tax=Mya arenaria TaxID=6604 RepID=A0ABY7GBM0_MYAAR|nr:hypothetical protein MAR_034340 [Mya arenaria]
MAWRCCPCHWSIEVKKKCHQWASFARGNLINDSIDITKARKVRLTVQMLLTSSILDRIFGRKLDIRATRQQTLDTIELRQSVPLVLSGFLGKVSFFSIVVLVRLKPNGNKHLIHIDWKKAFDTLSDILSTIKHRCEIK